MKLSINDLCCFLKPDATDLKVTSVNETCFKLSGVETTATLDYEQPEEETIKRRRKRNVDGRPITDTDAPQVYTLIQCTPLLVEKAGVAPVVTFRITARKQERVQARYPLWL